MEHYEIYIALIAVIATVGCLFRHFPAPTSLLLVIIGMLLSLLPGIPHVDIEPRFILDIFLPSHS